MRHILHRLLAPLAVLLGLAAQPAQAAPLEVVTSFSILGDFIRQVGGDRVKVTMLVAADQDAHNFQPRPSDARRIGAAQLVVASGLGFDPWLERLAQTAGYRGRILVASQGVEPIAATDEHDDAHGHGKSSHQDAVDPHAWQDVARAQRYVANIADALAQADPANAKVYRDNAARYAAELKALDSDIRTALAAVPAERRKVVSAHDAFGYFAHAYGVRFLAPAGISNQSEPSAAGVAQLIRQLRRENVPAVFVESVSDPRLIERIRKESGARLGGTLYSDALSAADGPAPTYVAMMRHNLRTLLDGMTPGGRN
ncbi:zinc/manganese transport system substrate-binding protein [Aromatoleum tolulyticum]|uniref:Zinc/manganese transport system substrate-binding protein n=1 Tax=Aromatoleum tolulyticum TaxID=34027 RepID=A0A1N6Z6H5_9RHOO|nr:metal ABC transporter substrate-binding protein [Aromatoleum tolulyticum]SIR22361.1 zinc/manganese transport system substrate-binding protein [Aromatoleum tolulyticum]